jgi:ATPase subunit of ABC transporter with duplicated ATPase domains
MTLSALVVFVSTIAAFGPTIGAVFGDLFSIGKGFADIQKVANLLNADTRRKQLLRGQMARAKLVEEQCAAHLGNLVISDLTFMFSGMDKSAFPPFGCNIDGGQIVALKGGGSAGKRIVLRLIARHYEPTTGFIHFPPFWRYRFLDANPVFFGGDMSALARIKARGGSDEALLQATHESFGTLDYNVKFGAQFKHPDPGIKKKKDDGGAMVPILA